MLAGDGLSNLQIVLLSKKTLNTCQTVRDNLLSGLLNVGEFVFYCPNLRPVRLAYQPPATSTFLSEQISHQQPASSTFLSQQISISHQPPAKRTGCWCVGE
jgi:hypothetical protein